jgi:hypothetical protein
MMQKQPDSHMKILKRNLNPYFTIEQLKMGYRPKCKSQDYEAS